MEMQEEARNPTKAPPSNSKEKREPLPIPDFATKVKAPKK